MELIAEELPGLWFAFVFAFGAVVGSFLNVVIARVPAGESVVSPPSRCPRCKSPIAWFDNIPILSWIVLRARCRGCGLPISARYPLVEALGGVLALAVVWRFGPTREALGFLAFAFILLALAFIDLDTWLLPHELTWPLLGLGMLSPLWNRGLGWRESAIGAAVGFGLFAAIALFGEKVMKRETMGWGDVWLLGALGAWLGIGGVFPVVMLSALQGALVGGLLIFLGRAPADAEARAKGDAEAGAEPRSNPSPAPSATANPIATATPVSTAIATALTDAPATATPITAATATAQGDATAPTADPTAPPSAAPEDDWVPPPHAVPYGPFLALAALQQLLIGDLLWVIWDEWIRRLTP